ncbi:hypothetical protein V490_06300 [Pseudogymnoascus sp. VKM F-3557]|nr:hypothetical protein V490_06300 [Pseudogymnoascus sp. VKM F-3557]
MKERLESFMATIDKPALLKHSQALIGHPVIISEAFSAGQYWCCFELVIADGRLMIARVRLPRHPDSTDSAHDDSEQYSIQCEVATMEFLHENVTGVPFPKLHVYEGPGSQRAADVGATYMLIEGFYGNSMQDVQFNICELPITTQEHIITQWTSIQAELARFSFEQIGSISHFAKDTGATIGKLSTAVSEGPLNEGPFSDTQDYFSTIADARFRQACKDDVDGSCVFKRLGPLVFQNIVRDTHIFKTGKGQFHFNHMDMGTQNILVDGDFNFLAIIDWEFAQAAPWEVNHYPMPFPLVFSDEKIKAILKDSDSIAHRNALERSGSALPVSIANVIDSTASRIYAITEKISVFEGMEEELTYEVVRLAYGYGYEEAKKYLDEMEVEMNDPE